jgi:hypothetical protein
MIDVNWRTALQWIFKNYYGRAWNVLIWLRIGIRAKMF